MFFAYFSEPSREKSKSLFYLILGLSLFGVVALVGIIIFAYACRGRIAHMIKQGGNYLFFPFLTIFMKFRNIFEFNL